MNTNLTEIIFLLDRSGSMGELEGDTIGGFNGFVKQQSEIGETRITTVLFDDQYELLHNGMKASDVALTEKEYFVRGMTALLDAVGKTIIDVGKRMESLDESERPGKVIFVITTDGQENSSREFTYDRIKAMIEHQKAKYNWEFIFMGANIDVASESSLLGIDPRMSMSYKATSAGTVAMWSGVGALTSGLRNPGVTAKSVGLPFFLLKKRKK